MHHSANQKVKVTSIKRSGNHLLVSFDNAEALKYHRSFPGGRAIKPKQVIDSLILQRLRNEAERHRAKLEAKKFLAKRARTRLHTERQLRKTGVNREIISDILDSLERSGYLNDNAYAKEWTEERLRLRPRAKHVIQKELRAAGINSETAAAAVQHIDDETVATTIAVQHKSLNEKTWETFQRKAGGQLYRRGYSYEVIISALQTAWKNRTGSLLDEMTSLT